MWWVCCGEVWHSAVLVLGFGLLDVFEHTCVCFVSLIVLSAECSVQCSILYRVSFREACFCAAVFWCRESGDVCCDVS